jgi:tubulin epsilon
MNSLDQMFKDCYHPDYQLICSNPYAHKYIAMGLIIRGPVAFSDVNRNIKKIKDEIDIVYWNREGFKYGICNVPPVGQVKPRFMKIMLLALFYALPSK